RIERVVVGEDDLPVGVVAQPAGVSELIEPAARLVRRIIDATVTDPVHLYSRVAVNVRLNADRVGILLAGLVGLQGRCGLLSCNRRGDDAEKKSDQTEPASAHFPALPARSMGPCMAKGSANPLQTVNRKGPKCTAFAEKGRIIEPSSRAFAVYRARRSADNKA